MEGSYFIGYVLEREDLSSEISMTTESCLRGRSIYMDRLTNLRNSGERLHDFYIFRD